MNNRPENTRWRRTWRIFVCLLIGVATWDTIGLFIGDSVFQSPSYTVLRAAATPFWGMRTYAVMLGTVAASAFVGYLRHVSGRPGPLLRISLSLLAGWFLAWLAAIVWAWALLGGIQGWPGFGVRVFMASVSYLVARSAPENDKRSG